MQGAPGASSATAPPRKVMVVADPTRESTGALQWTLSHAVLEQDELILLHVEPNSKRHSFSTFLRRPSLVPAVGASSTDGGQNYEFLYEMKMTCATLQPKLHVQIERVDMEGRDKAAAILLQAKVSSVDLLVIGQRRSSQTFIGRKLSGSLSNKGLDTAEYLIEHSKCLCVGVQKKGQNAGYLLNTKTRRNFWLLA